MPAEREQSVPRFDEEVIRLREELASANAVIDAAENVSARKFYDELARHRAAYPLKGLGVDPPV